MTQKRLHASKKEMKILMLGDTEAMGTPLTSILADKGHDVTVTSRKQRESKRSNVRFIQDNAKDYESIKKVTEEERYDAVVDFMSYRSPKFAERYQWLLSHASQYVFTSSARVFAEWKGKIKGDSPRLLDVCKDEEYLKTDEYALAKAREEDMLRNSGMDNWTIIRPSITYNDYRLQM